MPRKNDDIASVTHDPEIQAKFASIGLVLLPGRFSPVTASDLLSRPPPKYIVPGWIEEGSLAVLYGPTFTGKSFYAIDLGLHFADIAEPQWHGVKLGVYGTVAYVTGEGGGFSFGRRIQSAIEGNGLSPSLLSGGRFNIIEHAIDLRKAKVLREFIEANELYAYDVLIIDTLATNMSGSEDKTDEMGEAIKGAKYLQREIGKTVFLLHHPPRNAKRIRGSGALDAAVDTIIRFEKPNEGFSRVICEKVRNGPLPEDRQLFEIVRDGRGGYLKKVTNTDAGHSDGNLKEMALRILDVLRRNTLDGPIERSEWRRLVQDATPPILVAEKVDTNLKRFNRESEALISSGRVYMDKDRKLRPASDFDDDEPVTDQD